MRRRKKINVTDPPDEDPRAVARRLTEDDPGVYRIEGQITDEGRRVLDGDDPELSAGCRGFPTEDFNVREGDTLTIKWDGANLQIAPYSTVKLDSAIYSRQLLPGEDPVVAFREIHGYLRRECLKVARVKLREFAKELASAKKIAGE